MSVLDAVLAWPGRAAATVFAPRGAARLVILTFHRVLARPDPLLPGEPDAAQFAAWVRVLARHFTPLRLSEAADALTGGRLPARAVCITFDDGYADNCEVALPILKAHGLPATFFVATGYLDGGRMFNDTVIESVRRLEGPLLSAPELGIDGLPLGSGAQRRRAFEAVIGAIKYRPEEERLRLAADLAARASGALPEDLMMSAVQVRTLAVAGMELGAHTRNHPILARLEPARAKEEISAGKSDLEAILGRTVEVFAYPNGRPGRDYLSEHVEMVRAAGFRTAVSTAWGRADRHSPRLELPRMAPQGPSPAEFALRVARGFLERPVWTS